MIHSVGQGESEVWKREAGFDECGQRGSHGEGDSEAKSLTPKERMFRSEDLRCKGPKAVPVFKGGARPVCWSKVSGGESKR